MGCIEESIPNTEVPANEIHLDRNQGRFYHQSKLYSGFAVERYESQEPKRRTAYYHGKRHGLQEKWFADGLLAATTMYEHGKRHGEAKTWWKDGTLRSQSSFVHGVGHGIQRQWYRSGALFKEINLVQGKEQGMQRAWRENGAIYNNYEAKDGRTFGMKRSKMCFQLEEEDVVRSD